MIRLNRKVIEWLWCTLLYSTYHVTDRVVKMGKIVYTHHSTWSMWLVSLILEGWEDTLMILGRTNVYGICLYSMIACPSTLVPPMFCYSWYFMSPQITHGNVVCYSILFVKNVVIHSSNQLCIIDYPNEHYPHSHQVHTSNRRGCWFMVRKGDRSIKEIWIKKYVER